MSEIQHIWAVDTIVIAYINIQNEVCTYNTR